MRYRSGERKVPHFIFHRYMQSGEMSMKKFGGKRAMPGKEKIPINTVVIVKILYRDKEIVMSNIVRAIHDVVNVLGNFFIFPNN